MDPFDAIPRQSFMVLTALSGPRLDQRIRDGQLCLLSSLKEHQNVARPVNGRYKHTVIAADAVHTELASRFTADGLRWDLITDALPRFWPELLRYDAEAMQSRELEFAYSALDHAEASAMPVVMVITEYDGGLAGVTMGTMQRLADAVAAHQARGGPTLLRWTGIPVQEAIKTVRARAESGGIELPRYWSPPMTRADIEALPSGKRPAFMRGEP